MDLCDGREVTNGDEVATGDYLWRLATLGNAELWAGFVSWLIHVVKSLQPAASLPGELARACLNHCNIFSQPQPPGTTRRQRPGGLLVPRPSRLRIPAANFL